MLQWRRQVTVDLCIVPVEESSIVAVAVLPLEGSLGKQGVDMLRVESQYCTVLKTLCTRTVYLTGSIGA
jgi:hypothetical protein